MKPASMPVASPASRPIGMGTPQSVITLPIMTVVSVITVPTDRSMPPVMMTKVTPIARMPLTAVAIRMPLMLLPVRKYGDASEKKMNSRMSAPNARIRCAASERRMRGLLRSGLSCGRLRCPYQATPASV